MFIIHFLIAILATFFGALVGLGGGVIIKPSLDFLNQYDIYTISLLSSITVFSMTCVAIYLNLRVGFKLRKELLLTSLGALLGGYMGKMALGVYINILNNENLAKAIQSLVLLIVLIIVLVLTNRKGKTHNIQNGIVIFIVGLLLGTLSSFLGIGGGPINVSVLIFLFSFDNRYAVFSSIFIIFLSQGTKITSILLEGSIGNYDLRMIVPLIIGAVSGGVLGSRIGKRLSNENMRSIFNIAVVLIILLNAYNFYNFML